MPRNKLQVSCRAVVRNDSPAEKKPGETSRAVGITVVSFAKKSDGAVSRKGVEVAFVSRNHGGSIDERDRTQPARRTDQPQRGDARDSGPSLQEPGAARWTGARRRAERPAALRAAQHHDGRLPRRRSARAGPIP